MTEKPDIQRVLMSDLGYSYRIFTSLPTGGKSLEREAVRVLCTGLQREATETLSTCY